MHCNLLKLLKQIVNGATTYPEVKQKAPDVRKPQQKLAALVNTGYVEIDEQGRYRPTDRAYRIVPPTDNGPAD